MKEDGIDFALTRKHLTKDEISDLVALLEEKIQNSSASRSRSICNPGWQILRR